MARRERGDGHLTRHLHSVGLDVGGTKVHGVVIDPRHPTEVRAEERVATPEGGEGLVDVEVKGKNGLGEHVTGTVRIALPGAR